MILSLLWRYWDASPHSAAIWGRRERLIEQLVTRPTLDDPDRQAALSINQRAGTLGAAHRPAAIAAALRPEEPAAVRQPAVGQARAKRISTVRRTRTQ